MVRDAKEYIKNGDIFQIVLSNRLEAEGINLGCRPRNVSAMAEAVLDYARAHGKLPQTKEEG